MKDSIPNRKMQRARRKIVDDSSDEETPLEKATSRARRRVIVENSEDDAPLPKDSPREAVSASPDPLSGDSTLSQAHSRTSLAELKTQEDPYGLILVAPGVLSSPPEQQVAPVARMIASPVPPQTQDWPSSDDSLFYEPETKPKKVPVRKNGFSLPKDQQTKAKPRLREPQVKTKKKNPSQKSDMLAIRPRTKTRKESPQLLEGDLPHVKDIQRSDTAQEKKKGDKWRRWKQQQKVNAKKKEPADIFAFTAEQRTEIFEYYLIHGGAIEIPVRKPYVREPALLAVSKRIRAEALPIWYHENTFHSRFLYDICSWLDSLDPMRLNLLQWVNLTEPMPAGFILPAIRKMNKRLQDGLKANVVGVPVLVKKEREVAGKDWDPYESSQPDFTMVTMDSVELYNDLDGGWDTFHGNPLTNIRNVTEKSRGEPMEGVEHSLVSRREEQDETYVPSDYDVD